MKPAEEKALLDEVLDLRKKVQLLDGFGQEKDRMLCTIALMVWRQGGKVILDVSDHKFIAMWLAGQIQLEVTLGSEGTIFMVKQSKEGEQDVQGNASGPNGSDPGQSGV